MGGGPPKNKDNNKSTKKKSQLVPLEGGGVGGSEEKANNIDLTCILKFETMVNIPKAAININDKIFLIPSPEQNQLNLYFGNQNLGLYSGEKSAALWRCSNKGYEYIGNVLDIANTTSGLQLKMDIGTYTRE